MSDILMSCAGGKALFWNIMELSTNPLENEDFIL